MRTSSDCGRPDECSSDADCIGEKKCCFNDCGGKSCLPGNIYNIEARLHAWFSGNSLIMIMKVVPIKEHTLSNQHLNF